MLMDLLKKKEGFGGGGGGGGNSGSAITQVDPQTLSVANQSGICYGDRRYTWFWEENYVYGERAFHKLINGYY